MHYQITGFRKVFSRVCPAVASIVGAGRHANTGRKKTRSVPICKVFHLRVNDHMGMSSGRRIHCRPCMMQRKEWPASVAAADMSVQV